MLRCGPLVLLLVAACNPSTSSSATTNAAPVAPVTAPNTDVPFKAAVTTKQLMAEVLEPAANVYWEAVGSTTDARGTVEKVPKTDAEWTALRDAATIVAESGNLLMLDARARNHDEWMTLSRGLIDVGVRARGGRIPRFQGGIRRGRGRVRGVRQLPSDLPGRPEGAAGTGTCTGGGTGGGSTDQAVVTTGRPMVA